MITPEKRKEYRLRYNEKYPGRAREQQRKWRAKNPDKIREQRVEWGKRNAEERRKYLQAWRTANPEKIKEYEKRHRDKVRVCPDGIKQWSLVSRECVSCGRRVPFEETLLRGKSLGPTQTGKRTMYICCNCL